MALEVFLGEEVECRLRCGRGRCYSEVVEGVRKEEQGREQRGQTS